MEEKWSKAAMGESGKAVTFFSLLAVCGGKMGKQTPGGGQFSLKAKREGESWEDTEASGSRAD